MKVSEALVKVFEPGRLQLAWQHVRNNAGATGLDQMTVEEFAQREEHLLALIHDKLKSGTYRFQPARRVLIPKAGTSKMRKLGVPVVMDRVVGTSMHRVRRRSSIRISPPRTSASARAGASSRPYASYKGWCKKAETGRLQSI